LPGILPVPYPEPDPWLYGEHPPKKRKTPSQKRPNVPPPPNPKLVGKSKENISPVDAKYKKNHPTPHRGPTGVFSKQAGGRVV